MSEQHEFVCSYCGDKGCQGSCVTSPLARVVYPATGAGVATGGNEPDTQRGTGRTTRMLDDAKQAARSGEHVVVACATEGQKRELYAVLCAEEDARPTDAHRAKVHLGAGEISLMNRNDRMVDLRIGRYLGALPSALFFADHYAIELFLAEVGGWAWAEFRRSFGAQPQDRKEPAHD